MSQTSIIRHTPVRSPPEEEPGRPPVIIRNARLANFLVGCALVVPAGIIYKMNHTRKGAFLGMITGTVCMAVAGGLLNAFLLLPWYIANFFGGSADVLIQMGQAVHKSVNSVATFAILLVVPFNLFKAIVISILTLLLYKHVSRLIQTTIKKNEK